MGLALHDADDLHRQRQNLRPATIFRMRRLGWKFFVLPVLLIAASFSLGGPIAGYCGCVTAAFEADRRFNALGEPAAAVKARCIFTVSGFAFIVGWTAVELVLDSSLDRVDLALRSLIIVSGLVFLVWEVRKYRRSQAVTTAEDAVTLTLG